MCVGDGGLPARNQTGGNFSRFVEERLHPNRSQQTGVNNQLRPEAAFVRLFFNDACLVNKIGSRFCTAKRTVIRCYRSARAHDLICDCVTTSIGRKGIRQCQDTQCKLLRTILHFDFIHESL